MYFWQMYNQFPWLFKWIANRKELHRLNAVTKDQNLKIFSQAQKTLNPQKCRGFVDAFLAHKQNLEVRKPLDEPWTSTRDKIIWYGNRFLQQCSYDPQLEGLNREQLEGAHQRAGTLLIFWFVSSEDSVYQQHCLFYKVEDCGVC